MNDHDACNSTPDLDFMGHVITVADLVAALREELESARLQASFWCDRYNGRTAEFCALRDEVTELRTELARLQARE